MVDIKPDEISAILRQQLTNFNASADMEEVDDTYNIKDDDIMKKLNSDSFKNKKIARFLAQYENRKL